MCGGQFSVKPMKSSGRTDFQSCLQRCFKSKTNHANT